MLTADAYNGKINNVDNGENSGSSKHKTVFILNKFEIPSVKNDLFLCLCMKTVYISEFSVHYSAHFLFLTIVIATSTMENILAPTAYRRKWFLQ